VRCRRLHLLAVGLAAAAAWGGSCGGGLDVDRTSFDPACAALPELFPPALDIAPDRGDRLLALNFGPPLVLPFDVGGAEPVLATDTPVLVIPDDSDGDGIDEGSFQIPDAPKVEGLVAGDPALAAAGLALVTASDYEEVVVLRPSLGMLQPVEVSVPAGFRPEDYRRLPPPGESALRTAVSTDACFKPAAPIDSNGDDYAEGLPASVFCDPAWRGSFYANFTSGAALAAGRLFVSMTNLGTRAGEPDTRFLPGAVLVYDVDLAVDPPRVSPHPSRPFLTTEFYNPTHVTSYAVGGREFALVTVTGALGIERDDPATPDVSEGRTLVLSDAAIEVIDAETLEWVATYPMGPAALAFDRLSIDPSGRVAVVGGAADRVLYAVDLAPLASAPRTGPPLDLAGAVILGGDAPFRLPAREGGPRPEECSGATFGYAWNGRGDRVYLSEFCDGTFSVVGVTLPADPGDPVPAQSFFLVESRPLWSPLLADTFGQPRAPGVLRVRPGVPGVDFVGPDAFVIVSEPGAFCSLPADSI
jgi:hypothetical protein